MSAHTPGPWKALQMGDDYVVFKVPNHRVFSIRTGVIPSAEDARLIAAAPEMLAALKQEVLYSTDPWTRDRCRAIIAKARGESNG